MSEWNASALSENHSSNADIRGRLLLLSFLVSREISKENPGLACVEGIEWHRGCLENVENIHLQSGFIECNSQHFQQLLDLNHSDVEGVLQGICHTLSMQLWSPFYGGLKLKLLWPQLFLTIKWSRHVQPDQATSLVSARKTATVAKLKGRTANLQIWMANLRCQNLLYNCPKPLIPNICTVNRSSTAAPVSLF